MVFQLRHTTPRLILVHPSTLDKVRVAVEKAGLEDTVTLFLFDDRECRPLHGVDDWNTLLASKVDATQWQWEQLAPQEAVERVASINYSSGWVFLFQHTRLFRSLGIRG